MSTYISGMLVNISFLKRSKRLPKEEMEAVEDLDLQAKQIGEEVKQIERLTRASSGSEPLKQ